MIYSSYEDRLHKRRIPLPSNSNKIKKKTNIKKNNAKKKKKKKKK